MATKRDLLRDTATGFLMFLIIGGLVAAGVYFVLPRIPRSVGPLPPRDPIPAAYRPLVVEAGKTCPEIPSDLIAAQIDAESRWRPKATSGVGAVGISQFTPATWERFGKDHNGDGKSDPLDPADAIPSQADYMCQLYARMVRLKDQGYVIGEPLDMTMAAYNAGPEAVVNAHGIPDYGETKAYVAKIKQLRPLYAEWLYPHTSAPGSTESAVTYSSPPVPTAEPPRDAFPT